MDAIEKVLANIPKDSLPLPKKKDYLALVKSCLNFDPFVFNNEEYAQHQGLAMGSPLSPVASCLLMEMLEKEKFTKIMGNDTRWYRYVDDVFIVAPKDMDLVGKLQELNQVHDRIKFILEEEQDQALNFLDTTILREGTKFRRSVQKTNKQGGLRPFLFGAQRKNKVRDCYRVFPTCLSDL